MHSDLVQGEVVMALYPSLPVEGVDIILGNNLAGGQVWHDVPPPPVVRMTPSHAIKDFSNVFSACAVTHAKALASEGSDVAH